jgi:hypothetical protein
LQIGDLLLATDQVHFGIAPVAAVFCRQNIGIYRLVSAMKCAKAQMNDARNKTVAIVSWQRGVRC